MNKQEIFDKSVVALVRQGRQCTINDQCVYAGPDGIACAVGILLPRRVAERWDEEYPNGLSITKVIACCDLHYNVAADLRDIGISRSSLPLLAELQAIHDNSYRVVPEFPTWRDGFIHAARVLAEKYDLSTDALEAALAS